MYCPFEGKGLVIILITLIPLIRTPLRLANWKKLCSEIFVLELKNVLQVFFEKMVIFCDFSYLTAHTDTEGDSEEEKGYKKSPDAIAKSEDEELFNFLQQVDNLHKGSENDKKEGFRLLLEKDDKVLMGKLNITLLLTYALYCF